MALEYVRRSWRANSPATARTPRFARRHESCRSSSAASSACKAVDRLDEELRGVALLVERRLEEIAQLVGDEREQRAIGGHLPVLHVQRRLRVEEIAKPGLDDLLGELVVLRDGALERA